MNLTLLVRADMTGLGIQTRAYYKHLNPHKTVIIDISDLNGNQQHYDWYENAHLIQGLPNDEQIDYILRDTDVLMTAETPYNQKLYTVARERGIKTICVENPEFFDPFRYADYPLPDLIILPSTWKEQEIREYCEPRGTKVIQLHHPVDRDDFPYRKRTSRQVLHIAGKPATNDRNGTWDFMQAYPNGTVTTQSEDLAWNIRRKYRHSIVHTDIAHPLRLYDMGDILVLPRRYGGNCLPLNEALSTGMPVIMPDISPNNTLLPQDWLVPATITDHFEPRGRVDIYTCDINKLAERIEWVREHIEQESERANIIADSISWETLKDKWEDAIRSVL